MSSPTREERILAKMAELRAKEEEAEIEAEARRRLAEEARRNEMEYQAGWIPPTNPDSLKRWKYNGKDYFRDGHNNVYVLWNTTPVKAGVYKNGRYGWYLDYHDASAFAAKLRQDELRRAKLASTASVRK